jgi:hypothetical protein
MQNELNTIERKVRLMGGVVKSKSDIESLLKNSKSMKFKTEKLHYQLLYCKHFLNLEIENSDFAWKNTESMEKYFDKTAKIRSTKKIRKGYLGSSII